MSTEQVMVARLIQGVPKEYDDTATLCAQQKEFKELVNRLSRYQQWCTGDVMIRCDACGLDLCVACDTEKHTEVVKAPHVRVEVAGAAPEKCSACRNRSDRRAPFVCIATSSGTGKSQLAVTAQKCLQDRGGRVVYFNMSTIIDTSSQDFYKPHAELGKRYRHISDVMWSTLSNPCLPQAHWDMGYSNTCCVAKTKRRQRRLL